MKTQKKIRISSRSAGSTRERACEEEPVEGVTLANDAAVAGETPGTPAPPTETPTPRDPGTPPAVPPTVMDEFAKVAEEGKFGWADWEPSIVTNIAVGSFIDSK